MKRYRIDGEYIIFPVKVSGAEPMILNDYSYCRERLSDIMEENNIDKTDDWCDMSLDERMEYVNMFCGEWDLDHMRNLHKRVYEFDIELYKDNELIHYLENIDNPDEDLDNDTNYQIREYIEGWITDYEGEYIDYGSFHWEIDIQRFRDLRLEELGIV